jgi:rhodanese-related sulfurtransferase
MVGFLNYLPLDDTSILMKGFERNIGFIAHGVLNLTPRESFELSEKGAIIIDVREAYMNNFKMFQAENVLYLPYSELGRSYQDLPADRPLIFADSVGLKSREGVLFMMAHGYENVANMAGGIVDWERDGLPLTTDISNRLSGSCVCQLKAREGGSRKKGEEKKKKG